MVEYAKYELKNVCSRLSSGKSISSKMISEEGRYPVYGGNGLRGYTDHSNFSGDCAIIGRQGAFCGNVRYFSGEAYMTEHAVVVCANNLNNTHYLAYLLSNEFRETFWAVSPTRTVCENSWYSRDNAPFY